jgi:signal transduction histidine kinase
MKYLYPLLIALLSIQAGYAQVMAPELSRIKDYNQRMEAQLKYCNTLSGSDSGVVENYPAIIVAGLTGLRAARPDDAARKAHFALIAGGAYYNLMKFDSAMYYFTMAFGESSKSGSSMLIASAGNMLITMNTQMQHTGQADSFRNVLQSILDTTRDKATLTKVYSGLANYYYMKSYYGSAQEYILKGLELNEKIADTTRDYKFKKDYAIQNYLLYKIYMNNGMPEKAIYALRKGSRYMYTSPTLTLRYYAAFIDAFANKTQPSIDSALHYYTALQVLPRTSKGISSELVTSNIIIAQYYIYSHQPERALPYVEKSDTLAAQSNSPFLIHQAQNIKGMYLYYTGDYDGAIKLLNQSIAVSRNINKGNYAESLQYIAMAYKAKGNFDKAVSYYELSNAVKDSLTRENMNRNFADLETQYRTKEKEQQILTLNTEGKVRELELRNANRMKFLLIGGLIALGLISLLLYRIYRHKEKLNKVLNDRNSVLDQLNAKLALANESKAKLFGIFSHDLRSPVSKISQFLRLQKENPGLFTDNARSEYHDKFTHTTEHLLNTMEDLLLWSKSQMENFKPEFHPVSIHEVAQREIDLLNNQIEEKRLSIESEIPSGFKPLTDENFVAIIMRNLLQNAVRYSEEPGTITLKIANQTLAITNRSSKPVQADTLNGLLKKNEINSNTFGLGLQIARDLAERIGISVSFEQRQEGYITALIQWK